MQKRSGRTSMHDGTRRRKPIPTRSTAVRSFRHSVGATFCMFRRNSTSREWPRRRAVLRACATSLLFRLQPVPRRTTEFVRWSALFFAQSLSIFQPGRRTPHLIFRIPLTGARHLRRSGFILFEADLFYAIWSGRLSARFCTLAVDGLPRATFLICWKNATAVVPGQRLPLTASACNLSNIPTLPIRLRAHPPEHVASARDKSATEGGANRIALARRKTIRVEFE